MREGWVSYLFLEKQACLSSSSKEKRKYWPKWVTMRHWKGISWHWLAVCNVTNMCLVHSSYIFITWLSYMQSMKACFGQLNCSLDIHACIHSYLYPLIHVWMNTSMYEWIYMYEWIHVWMNTCNLTVKFIDNFHTSVHNFHCVKFLPDLYTTIL